ncbi:HdeD family acid-resistance protein [uncultured Enterovirga sp.]|uniref:HdeD family acid-resistance protein n=1 Tax=uncultured Enterovirga sp. TaxID=2026352 RepID=UPI0035CBF13B
MSPTSLSSSSPSDASRTDARNAVLARNWWVVALRGAFAVLFGALTFAMPGLSLATLVVVFAAYLFVDGVFAIVAGIRAAQKHERWGFLILEGLVNILAAIAAMASPGAAVVFVVYLIAIWSIVSGGFMTVAAFQLHLDHGRWLLVISGVVSILFGILLAISPVTGAVVLTLWLGAYALVFGAMLIGFAFQLRKHGGAALASRP